MINNNVEDLRGEFKDKVKVFLAVVKIYKKNVAIFEGFRTKDRQKWLVANGKSWTMNSYHLKGKAVDLAFLNEEKQPTWIGDYSFLHYIGFFCGMTPIYNSKGQLIESCHLQDDGRSIKKIMETNSNNRHKAKSKQEKDYLNQVNTGFRLLHY